MLFKIQIFLNFDFFDVAKLKVSRFCTKFTPKSKFILDKSTKICVFSINFFLFNKKKWLNLNIDYYCTWQLLLNLHVKNRGGMVKNRSVDE